MRIVYVPKRNSYGLLISPSKEYRDLNMGFGVYHTLNIVRLADNTLIALFDEEIEDDFRTRRFNSECGFYE